LKNPKAALRITITMIVNAVFMSAKKPDMAAATISMIESGSLSCLAKILGQLVRCSGSSLKPCDCSRLEASASDSPAGPVPTARSTSAGAADQ